MNNIVMTVYSSRPMSYKERLKYAAKAFTHNYTIEKNIGYITKFNNALGFKRLEYDDEKHVTEIESPDGYRSPYSLLLINRYFFNKENEIMTFVIPDMTMKHNLDEYTYKTLPMLFKFQSFLYKVFPNDIRIEFTIKPETQYPTKVNILSHFWNCLSEGECVDTEMSIGHEITKNEKKYVLDVIRQIVSYEPDISCFLCEACYEYHPDYPYHIELIDKNKDDTSYLLMFDYYNPSRMKEEAEYEKQLKKQYIQYYFEKKEKDNGK
ncbi:hypothetical protein DW886_15325 [Enterocloster aldenensis]|uniref:hypothetical protein n=1 Tax=Enterocloster aldenensis TaxID=358742 RepID=UPI000E508DAE|nr:hypothetical protein DW886_15325 [Enterocloster aldenensis]